MENTNNEYCSKKRKLSTEGAINVQTEDTACLEVSHGSQESEIIEPDQISTVPLQSCDSGIDSLTFNSQVSLESLSDPLTVSYTEKRLLELEDEVQRLRAENETLKSKSCQCVQLEGEAIVTIKFNNLDNYMLYKNNLRKIFDPFINLEVREQESNLLLGVYKDDFIDKNDWVVVDEIDCGVLHDKRKKKKKRKSSSNASNVEVDIFVLDTKPSLSTKSNLQYDKKFDLVNAVNKSEEVQTKPVANISLCFNCEEAHNLKDCKKPRDYQKINALRQKLKMQNKSNMYKRYHLEDDQKYGNLQPGLISDKLQDALGLRSNQLPEYIYRMRQLGYPPGWYNEIVSLQESSLVLFDFNGKDAGKLKKNVQDLDINKIVDYHGFNVPVRDGYKDEHRLYGCSAYSKQYSKQKMIDHLLSLKKESEDNLENCDMDIDNNPSDKEIENINASSVQNGDDKNNKSSPTLVELETEKEKLLAELTEDEIGPQEEEEVKDTSKEADLYVTIDTSGIVEDLNSTPCNVDVSTSEAMNGSCDAEASKLNIIRTSTYGTPILKSASPYSRLPKSENFTKDVSDVINFENLPNSTGKYDQMVGVIEKVRTTLKNLNEQRL